MSRRGRPLVLLDVDGVLNRGLFLSSAKRSKLKGRDGWVSTRAGSRHDPLAPRIVLNRHWGRLLLSMQAAGGELAWATMWEEAANWYIAPLLGIEPLPWVPIDRAPRCKAVSVIPWTQGRPWAWLEDRPDELEAAVRLGGGRPHLPVLTQPETGITEDHADQVKEWLGSL